MAVLQIFFDEEDGARLALRRPGLCYDLPRDGVWSTLDEGKKQCSAITSKMNLWTPRRNKP